MSDAMSIQTVTKLFLDSESTAKATTRMERKALSKIGAFIRTRAQRSMRPAGKKGKVSRPGEPPRTRLGFLKKFLYFVFVPETRSVVVGPAQFRSTSKRDAGPVPGLLEAGGEMNEEGRVIYVTRPPGRDASGRFKAESKRRVVLHGRVRIARRPYMHPAYEAELPKFAGQFEGEFSNN